MSKNVPTFDIVMEYPLLSKAKAKELKGLVSKKERERQGLFIVEGEKSVLDTLQSLNLQYLVATQQWLNRNLDLCMKFSDKVLMTDKRGIEIISSLNSKPEVIAVYRLPEEDNDIPLLDSETLYVLLDEVQDPGNLGTIIRTCDWFGVYDIFASRNTADVFSPKVVQSTMGSLARVKVHYVDLKKLVVENSQLPLIGTVLNGESIKNLKVNQGGMLLMGNEGRGISEELMSLITYPVTIPPYNSTNHPDSLNVGIATAIMLNSIRNHG